MKKGHFIAGALLGLAFGIPVASRMAARTEQRQKDAATAPATTPSPPSERKAGFSLQGAVEQRDPLPDIKSAGDFMAFKREAADRSGSPFRATAAGATVLDQLPIGELVALLEAGELSDLNEVAGVFTRWLEADPLAAYEKFQQLPLTTDQRHVARSMIFSHWAKHQPERMLALLEKRPEGELKQSDAQYFLSAWQNEDPGQALMFLDRLAGLGSFGADTTKIREDLLAAWMGKDQEAVARWLEALPPGEAKDALENAAEGARLSQMPYANAVTWIRDHPGQTAAQQRLSEILGNWVNSEPAAALFRLAEFPEDHPVWGHEASGIAQRAMVTATMGKNTDSLVATVNGLPEGAPKRKLLLGLIQGSASNDLAMATHLLAGLPESGEREQASSHYAELLTRKDPAAASEWLRGLGPSASRDAAADRFAATLAAEQPALAAEWADSIADPAQAAGARHVVYARWHEHDPQAADQWRQSWPKAADGGR